MSDDFEKWSLKDLMMMMLFSVWTCSIIV